MPVSNCIKIKNITNYFTNIFQTIIISKIEEVMTNLPSSLQLRSEQYKDENSQDVFFDQLQTVQMNLNDLNELSLRILNLQNMEFKNKLKNYLSCRKKQYVDFERQRFQQTKFNLQLDKFQFQKEKFWNHVQIQFLRKQAEKRHKQLIEISKRANDQEYKNIQYRKMELEYRKQARLQQTENRNTIVRKLTFFLAYIVLLLVALGVYGYILQPKQYIIPPGGSLQAVSVSSASQGFGIMIIILILRSILDLIIGFFIW